MQEKKKNEQRELGEVKAKINHLKNSVEFQEKDEELRIKVNIDAMNKRLANLNVEVRTMIMQVIER